MKHYFLKSKHGGRYIKRDTSQNKGKVIGTKEIKTKAGATIFNEKEADLIIEQTRKALVKEEYVKK